MAGGRVMGDGGRDGRGQRVRVDGPRGRTDGRAEVIPMMVGDGREETHNEDREGRAQQG